MQIDFSQFRDSDKEAIQFLNTHFLKPQGRQLPQLEDFAPNDLRQLEHLCFGLMSSGFQKSPVPVNAGLLKTNSNSKTRLHTLTVYRAVFEQVMQGAYFHVDDVYEQSKAHFAMKWLKSRIGYLAVKTDPEIESLSGLQKSEIMKGLMEKVAKVDDWMGRILSVPLRFQLYKLVLSLDKAKTHNVYEQDLVDVQGEELANIIGRHNSGELDDGQVAARLFRFFRDFKAVFADASGEFKNNEDEFNRLFEAATGRTPSEFAGYIDVMAERPVFQYLQKHGELPLVSSAFGIGSP